MSQLTPSPPPSMAILDDYAALAPPFFQSLLASSTLDSVTSLPPHSPSADPHTPSPALIAALQPYQILCTMRERTPFPGPLLAALPNLRLLLTTGPRNAAIDLPAATRLGITVAGTRGAIPESATERDELLQLVGELPPPDREGAGNLVVQHASALLLGLCSRVAQCDARLRTPGSEAWQNASTGTVVSLAGKTLGVVGLGKLGALFAAVAQKVWGMKVLAWSANLTLDGVEQQAVKAGCGGMGWRMAGSLEELCREADVLSLHYVLSDRSRGMFGAKELGWLKPTAMLVNTARAGLIDEQTLIAVLKEGRVAGVAMDVFWEEPLGVQSVWRKVDEWVSPRSQVLLSPHMGYVHAGTLGRWYQEQAENVRKWVAGEELVNRMN